MDYSIVTPTQPKIIREEDSSGTYEIDGLYPGYGHTLGNSLRRVILSSLPGAAITSVKIDGVSHEFATIEGVREDVITILLNLKKVRIKMHTDEPQILRLKAKDAGPVTAGDMEIPSQVEVLNPDLVIAHLSTKNSSLDMELRVERGLGYVPKEVLQSDRIGIGTIALDALFSPIRRVNYEVENMRVGERTDFNRLRIFIETDGTIEPKEVLERSIIIMIKQLKAVVGFKEEEEEEKEVAGETEEDGDDEPDAELLKTRVESLGLSTRTENALTGANVRTLGGLVRKNESDLLAIEGLGKKGLTEIRKALKKHKVSLNEEE